MFPVFSIGPWHDISTYALAYAVAISIGGTLAYRRLLVFKLPRRTIWLNTLWLAGAVLAGLEGPSLLGMAVNRVSPGILGGNAPTSRVYTALAAGIFVGVFRARRERVDFWRAADRAVLGFALGYGLARFGCYAAGCCGGMRTDASWAVFLPNEAGEWAMRYPMQMISGVAELAIFAGLMLFERARERHGADHPLPGLVFLLYVLLFCLERFAVEFFRADWVALVGPFSAVHVGMFAGMCVSAALIAWRFAQPRATHLSASA